MPQAQLHFEDRLRLNCAVRLMPCSLDRSGPQLAVGVNVCCGIPAPCLFVSGRLVRSDGTHETKPCPAVRVSVCSGGAGPQRASECVSVCVL